MFQVGEDLEAMSFTHNEESWIGILDQWAKFEEVCRLVNSIVLDLIILPWFYKMFTLGEVGGRIFKKSLYIFATFL